MSDPFLDAHRAARLFYKLTGASPISVRDQIVRGALLVERLLESGEISAPTGEKKGRPLCVVGAGVAGAATAIAAAEVSVETELWDIGNSAFRLQRYAPSRTLDPTQYDWPLDHWALGHLPWRASPPAPLDYATARASDLAVDWRKKLRATRRKSKGKLVVKYATTLGSMPFISGKGSSALISLQDSPHGAAKLFGCLVDATGLGEENCEIYKPLPSPVPNPAPAPVLLFEGQAFWSPDTLTSLPPGTAVLVSGGGDGGLQDFLRAATKLQTAEAILNRVNLPPDILNIVQSAETRAFSGRRMAADQPAALGKAQEKPFMENLHKDHMRAVRKALTSGFVRHQLSLLLQPILSGAVSLALVHRDDYLTCYYGLNRFLVLLVDEYLSNHTSPGISTRFPNCTIDTVSPASHHKCTMTFRGKKRASGLYSPSGVLTTSTCFLKPHNVTFTTPTTGTAPTGTFGVVVVRHGVKANSNPLSVRARPLARARHDIPFFLP